MSRYTTIAVKPEVLDYFDLLQYLIKQIFGIRVRGKGELVEIALKLVTRCLQDSECVARLVELAKTEQKQTKCVG